MELCVQYLISLAMMSDNMHGVLLTRQAHQSFGVLDHRHGWLPLWMTLVAYSPEVKLIAVGPGPHSESYY